MSFGKKSKSMNRIATDIHHLELNATFQSYATGNLPLNFSCESPIDWNSIDYLFQDDCSGLKAMKLVGNYYSPFFLCKQITFAVFQI